MDDAAAESPHLLERCVEIADREIRQREGVARTAAANVNADGRAVSMRLPPVPLAIRAFLERCAEDS